MKQVCFLFLLFPLLLGSCVTSSYGLAREVRLGMTEAQVIHLLGAPQAREETPDSANGATMGATARQQGAKHGVEVS